jgi:hypothetical protein
MGEHRRAFGHFVGGDLSFFVKKTRSRSKGVKWRCNAKPAMAVSVTHIPDAPGT